MTDFFDRLYGMTFKLFLDPNAEGEGNEVELVLGATIENEAYFHAKKGLLQRKPKVANPAYDRDLIAGILEDYANNHRLCDVDLKYLESSALEQAQLLREADNADAAGVHTAKRKETKKP